MAKRPVPARGRTSTVAGSRPITSSWTGWTDNQVSDNLVGYAPAVDAIQEFNEITLNAPAEFGNYMGGIVSATIKSGTNAFAAPRTSSSAMIS